MKKTLNRILVIAAGAILLAFTITVRNAKAEWQHSEAYGYNIWCDVGRFCSGPISAMTVEDILRWLRMNMPWLEINSYWIEDHPYWIEDWLYALNPVETHYGICEWVPPRLGYGLPCACMDIGFPQVIYYDSIPLTTFFAVIESHDPCGYAVPIS